MEFNKNVLFDYRSALHQGSETVLSWAHPSQRVLSSAPFERQQISNNNKDNVNPKIYLSFFYKFQNTVAFKCGLLTLLRGCPALLPLKRKNTIIQVPKSCCSQLHQVSQRVSFSAPSILKKTTRSNTFSKILLL